MSLGRLIRHRPRLVACAAPVLILALLIPSAFTSTKSSIPILIVDGQSGGPYHNWKLTSQILQKELEETGIFQVTVATSPQSGGGFTNFHPRFADYQAIVWNYDAPDWPADLRSEFEGYYAMAEAWWWFMPLTTPFPTGVPGIK